MLWHVKTQRFYVEEIPEEEFVINTVSHTTKNTIVVRSDKYVYSLLLRWKNGKGILNPAFQISVKTS